MANYTGNFIQINPDQANNYVLTQLRKYDVMTSKGIEPKTNPYREPIIMTLDDSRQVEIPDEIQRAVIAQHVSDNAVLKTNYESKFDAPEIDRHMSDDDDEQSATSVFFQVAVCLVIIMTILYLLTLVRKGVLVV
jgi:hypothetical protein